MKKVELDKIEVYKDMKLGTLFELVKGKVYLHGTESLVEVTEESERTFISVFKFK